MDTTNISAKRPRTVQHPAVEEAVAFWVLQCQHRGVALTGDLIRAKAQTFAGSMGVSEENIRFSNGWLHKFQQRHKLRAVRIHGESGSADMGALEEGLPHLKAVVAGYTPRDVYNMDETGRSENTVQYCTHCTVQKHLKGSLSVQGCSTV